MNTVNFNQLICKNVSGKAENISGIFDTLVCEKGKNTIFVYVISSQILDKSASNYDSYYYRIVLRQFGNSPEDLKSYRIDSGSIWDAKSIKNSCVGDENQTRHTTTRSGSTVKLIIEYEHDFEIQGHHEIDVYAKKLEEGHTMESAEKLSVKELDLVSICPFNVIFLNDE